MARAKTIDEILSSEIKRDVAERYFSFRKLIEDDKMALDEKIRQYSFILQKRISFDLIRIYILLKKETLIDNFLRLAGLEKKLFFDSYLTESETIASRVFRCQKFTGFTRVRRFRNFLLECYEGLYYHTVIYHQHIKELEEDQKLIIAEIKQFYKENDLSAILGFMHRLGDKETCCMEGGIEEGLVDKMTQSMKIQSLTPIDKILIILPPLTFPSKIKRDLKKLAKQAYKIQSKEFLAIFEQRQAPCDRLGM